MQRSCFVSPLWLGRSLALPILALFAVMVRGAAAELPENYASLGELIIVPLDTAPFPHPDRAQGHVYNKELFTAEKSYSDNRVALFVPKGYRRADKTDFVIHFHGWRNDIAGVLGQFHLVEQFVAAGRNAILVVPQGPRNAPDSFGGKLEDENGFARFMIDVVATLRQHNAIPTTNLGDIILSGHSGGYEVISSILARGGLPDHVREVWLFDALYGRTEKFMDWFDRYHGRRLIDIYTVHGGTREETEKLMARLAKTKSATPFLAKREADVTTRDLENNRLIFIDSALEHNDVLVKQNQFCEYLQTSSFADSLQTQPA